MYPAMTRSNCDNQVLNYVFRFERLRSVHGDINRDISLQKFVSHLHGATRFKVPIPRALTFLATAETTTADAVPAFTIILEGKV